MVEVIHRVGTGGGWRWLQYLCPGTEPVRVLGTAMLSSVCSLLWPFVLNPSSVVLWAPLGTVPTTKVQGSVFYGVCHMSQRNVCCALPSDLWGSWLGFIYCWGKGCFIPHLELLCCFRGRLVWAIVFSPAWALWD